MLTQEQKQINKVTFTTLLTSVGIDAFPILQLLEGVDYFDKPVTAQQFRAYSGGLCEYALDLCYELSCLCQSYCPDVYSKETIVKVALLRDIYRATIYEPGTRNVKNPNTGAWEEVLVWQSAEQRVSYGNIGFSSYMQLRNLLAFSDEEIEAMCNGGATNSYSVDEAKVRRCFPLVALLAMADYAVSYIPNSGAKNAK